MKGCEKFQLLPGANSGKLSPTFENPLNFDGIATVAVTYTNGLTGDTGASFNYTGFPGVSIGQPSSSNTYYVSYTFTKNGAKVGSGSVPAKSGDGYFIDTNYTPSALGIANGTYQMGYLYCLNVSADPIDGFVQNDGTILSVSNSGPGTQTSCDTVHNEPYVHFFGNDVNAGGGFGNGCTTDTTGGIYTFVSGAGAQPNGSGAQFGAQALSIIEGFASANLRTGIPTGPTGPKGLTFSNTTTVPSNGADAPGLGGNFGLSSYCLPDYYGAKPAGLTAQPSGNINIDEPDNAGSNPKLYNGPVTIYTPPPSSNVSKIGNAANEAIYVNGDVYIRNNITYTGAGSWSSIAQIPSLYVVATGNIYIDPGVTRLDGIYIAESNSEGTGIINTCVNVSTTPFYIYKVSELGGGACDEQLTVNGAFVAKQVFLDRSYSSLRYSHNGENPWDGQSYNCGTAGIDVPFGDPSRADCAAEIFNFSPELYLSQPANTPNSGPTTGIFDYITSLSPVL
jgi:hypothetical protein